jgi:HEAT repeat protein
MGNRGVAPDRAFEILMSSIRDENVNVRYWAVEGLAYLGTEDTIAPLLVSSTTIRRRSSASARPARSRNRAC